MKILQEQRPGERIYGKNSSQKDIIIKNQKTRKPTNLMWRHNKLRDRGQERNNHGSFLQSIVFISTSQVRVVHRSLQSIARHQSNASRSLGIEDASINAKSVRRWYWSRRRRSNRYDWLLPAYSFRAFFKPLLLRHVSVSRREKSEEIFWLHFCLLYTILCFCSLAMEKV